MLLCFFCNNICSIHNFRHHSKVCPGQNENFKLPSTEQDIKMGQLHTNPDQDSLIKYNLDLMQQQIQITDHKFEKPKARAKSALNEKKLDSKNLLEISKLDVSINRNISSVKPNDHHNQSQSRGTQSTNKKKSPTKNFHVKDSPTLKSKINFLDKMKDPANKLLLADIQRQKKLQLEQEKKDEELRLLQRQMKREQKKLEKQNKYKFGDNITKIEVKKTPKGEKTIISPINSNKQLEKSPIQFKIKKEFYDNKVLKELRQELEKIEKKSMSPSRIKNQNQFITPKDLYNKGKPIDQNLSPINKYIEKKTGIKTQSKSPFQNKNAKQKEIINKSPIQIINSKPVIQHQKQVSPNKSKKTLQNTLKPVNKVVDHSLSNIETLTIDYSQVSNPTIYDKSNEAFSIYQPKLVYKLDV